MLTSRGVTLRLLYRHASYTQRRWKKKEHWAELRRKKTNTDRALAHFDDLYGKLFGPQWASVRVALLTPHKYCALLNNFGDTERTETALENEGALNLRRYIEVEKQRLGEKSAAEGEAEARGEPSQRPPSLQQAMGSLAAARQEEEISRLYPSADEGAKHAGEHWATAGAAPEQSPAARAAPDTSLTAGAAPEASPTEQLDADRLVLPGVGLAAAALYEFVPATRLKGMEDWVPESTHYAAYGSPTDFPVTVRQEQSLAFPPTLKVFVFERGNISGFPEPRRGSTGVYNYCLLDASSLLPVLALGLEPGDSVLDLCAAPGIKSLAALQTLYPAQLVCNDIQLSRTNRITRLFGQFLYNLDRWQDQISITQMDGCSFSQPDSFSKVLVDVPCTTDRHSLNEDDNNIFKSTRTKERLVLPQLQTDLLVNGLKQVAPGGTVVYSTCSLSPVQNDGVVHMALRRVWEETNAVVEVRDLGPALQPLRSVFRFADIDLRYGHLVQPFLPCNFGPAYFCKLFGPFCGRDPALVAWLRDVLREGEKF